MHILVADDDKTLRDYIETSIPEDFNGVVDIVGTAEGAIDLIKTNKYDKAVIDLRFENQSKDGFDILRCAKENGIPERIIFTSVSNQLDIETAGATAAFRKPLSIKKIAKFLLTSDYSILEEGEIF